MATSTVRRLRWVIGVSIGILIVNSFVLYSSIVAFTSSARALREAVEFRDTLSDVLIELLNAETGQRGFLIKGDELYLEPYYLASERLDHTLAKLDRLALTDPGDAAEIADIRSLARTKFAELRKAIDDYHGGMSSAAIPLERGKTTMDALRTSIGTIEERIRTIVSEEQDNYDRSQERASLALLIFIVGVSSLLVLIFSSARREIRNRKADGERIAEYARTLDESVLALKRERHEIRQLNEASSYLQSCNSLAELATVFVPLAEGIYAGHRGALYVYAASRNQLDLVAPWGGFVGGSFMLATDCWGLRRGQLHEHTAGSGTPSCGHLHEELSEGKDGTICLPLLAHGETMGLLTIVADRGTGDAAEHQSLIASAPMLARQLSLTLANMRLRETLNDQLVRDPLTNAFNRRYLELMAENETAQARRTGRGYVVAMIDIDHFKRFNDIHGHSAGDAALVLVACHIQRSIREMDWLVRYGGEEFLLILREISAADGEARLEDLVRSVAELSLRTGETALPNVTISVGVAAFGVHGTDFDGLVRQADEALYEAKHHGRNQLRVATEQRPLATS
ncbi:MAG: diguanylate cyclase [Bosea sp.]|nr:diguanylate cyclase [Bosea sp. (in: a-proteobacteria)]